MDTEIDIISCRRRRIRRWALVGGLFGLLFTLSLPGVAYLAPDNVDPLFMLSFHILVTFPASVIWRALGLGPVSLEPSHQTTSTQILVFVVVSVVNIGLFAVLSALIASAIKPRKPNKGK